MNELETIVSEVHDHIINNKHLDEDILFRLYKNNIIIKYFTFTLCLKKQHFIFQLDPTGLVRYFEHYVIEKDLHFELNIMGLGLCNLECVQKMIELREWYGLTTNIEANFLIDYHEISSTN